MPGPMCLGRPGPKAPGPPLCSMRPITLRAASAVGRSEPSAAFLSAGRAAWPSATSPARALSRIVSLRSAILDTRVSAHASILGSFLGSSFLESDSRGGPSPLGPAGGCAIPFWVSAKRAAVVKIDRFQPLVSNICRLLVEVSAGEGPRLGPTPTWLQLWRKHRRPAFGSHRSFIIRQEEPRIVWGTGSSGSLGKWKGSRQNYICDRPSFSSFKSRADKSAGDTKTNCRPFLRWSKTPCSARSSRSVRAV